MTDNRGSGRSTLTVAYLTEKMHRFDFMTGD